MKQAVEDVTAQDNNPWKGLGIAPTGLVDALIGAPNARGGYDEIESFSLARIKAIYSQSSQMSHAALEAVTIVGKLISFRDEGFFNDYELTKAGRAVALLGELAEVLQEVASTAEYFAKKQEVHA